MLFKKQINWYKIFDSTDALNSFVKEGSLNTIYVGKKKICLAHTSEGFFAVDDKCPHNGASLSNGFCTASNSIVCPVHRYHFDLTTGRAKSGGGDCLNTYPLEIRNNGIFIGINETVWNLF